eukprot:jgi/Tetstr1/459481/TSEL_004848.t1
MSVDPPVQRRRRGPPQAEAALPAPRGRGLTAAWNGVEALRGRWLPRPSSAAQHRTPRPAKQHQQQGRVAPSSGRAVASRRVAQPGAPACVVICAKEEAAPSPAAAVHQPAVPPTAPQPTQVRLGSEPPTQPAPPQAQRSPFASASPQHQQPRPPSRSPPPAPNASDLSLELTCDSTLVGIQQQREAALHGRSASASAVELNPADAAPLPPAWSEQLHAVAEGAGHRDEAEGGARTWGRLERGHSLRDVNTLNEKQAEE